MQSASVLGLCFDCAFDQDCVGKPQVHVEPYQGTELMMLSLPGKCTTSVATGVLPRRLAPQVNHQLDQHPYCAAY